MTHYPSIEQMKINDQLFQNLIGNAIKYRSEENSKDPYIIEKEETNIFSLLRIMELE